MTEYKEKIQVAGSELMDKIKALIAEGDVRRIVVRKESGKQLVAIPLNAGAAVGAGVVLAAPVLAVLGVAAGLLTNLTLEIERTDQVEVVYAEVDEDEDEADEEVIVEEED